MNETPKIEVDRDFLVRVDSIASLLAYRYPNRLVGIADDPSIVDELKQLSSEARRLYEQR